MIVDYLEGEVEGTGTATGYSGLGNDRDRSGWRHLVVVWRRLNFAIGNRVVWVCSIARSAKNAELGSSDRPNVSGVGMADNPCAASQKHEFRREAEGGSA